MTYGKKARPPNQMRFNFGKHNCFVSSKAPLWRVDTKDVTAANGKTMAIFRDRAEAQKFASQYSGSELNPASTVENQTFLSNHLPNVISDADYKTRTDFETFLRPSSSKPLEKANEYAEFSGGVLFSEIKINARGGLLFLYVKQTVPMGKSVNLHDPTQYFDSGGFRDKNWGGQATGVYVVVKGEKPTLWNPNQKQVSFNVK